uniref:Uncharacterized protein n=1 Tax=Picea sitchensis TaxID=3332 RepID=A0A6B9XVE2_PICSI|nr:hypothetical protein Q903MT_gene4324 [Picea sitchensis]
MPGLDLCRLPNQRFVSIQITYVITMLSRPTLDIFASIMHIPFLVSTLRSLILT